MIYRITPEWIEKRRRTARFAALLVALLAVAILALVLGPRVNWSRPHDRTAAIFVCCVVLIGLVIGGLAGRMNFRIVMRRWESFSVELTPEELIRQMDGQETRIQRNNVKSIREFGQRGFVIVDNLGWRIFVPKMVENYADFRKRILSWGNKNG